MSGEHFVVARLRRWKLWLLMITPVLILGWGFLVSQITLVRYGVSFTDFSWYRFPSDWPAERVFAGIFLIVLCLLSIVWPLVVLLRGRDLIEVEDNWLWIGRRRYPLSSLASARAIRTFLGDSVRIRFVDGRTTGMNLTFAADRSKEVAAELNRIATGAAA